MAITSLEQELAQLAECTTTDFVVRRRQLIERVLCPDGGAIVHLVELQQSIDQSLAVCATPRNRLHQLRADLDERIEALAALTRRLEREVGVCD